MTVTRPVAVRGMRQNSHGASHSAHRSPGATSYQPASSAAGSRTRFEYVFDHRAKAGAFGTNLRRAPCAGKSRPASNRPPPGEQWLRRRPFW